MKIMTVFGTRPEAIKMAPVVQRLACEPGIQSIVCVTGQHRQMLDQVLDFFGIVPDHDLQLMVSGQSLNGLMARAIDGVDRVLAEVRPDRVLVHGDTTTASAAAIAAFNRQIKVAHVEAGLRTYNLEQPWPEEMNRRIIDVVADHLFAPTPLSRRNLEGERLHGRITVTGNTVIDALHWTVRQMRGDAALRARLDAQFSFLDGSRRLVLVTGHRRENFGAGFQEICEALAQLAEHEVDIVYPVHLNPNVREPVHKLLGHLPNVHLIDPLSYVPFIYLLQRCDLVLTDSGGVQEEAPAIGKPVLVMREATERPEAIRAGLVQVVGTDPQRITAAAERLLRDHAIFRPVSPYGDGRAADRIVDTLCGRPVTEFSPDLTDSITSIAASPSAALATGAAVSP